MSWHLSVEKIMNKTYFPKEEVQIQSVNPADFVDEFLQEKSGQVMGKTFETIRCTLRRGIEYFADMEIEHPRHQDVWKYMEALRKSGHKPATVCVYMSALRNFFQWLRMKEIYPDITQSIELPKIDRIKQRRGALTDKQFEQVLTSIERDTLLGKRNYAMIYLMGKTGLRCNEVSLLNVNDMRVKGMLGCVLWVQTKGHTQKDEYVRLPPKCEEAIRDYLAARGECAEDAPLFASTANRNRGGRIDVHTISYIIKKQLKQCGYNSDKLTAHSLRHTAITQALRNGARLEHVAEMARHDCVSSTVHYDHRRKNQRAMEQGLRSIADHLDNVLSGLDSTYIWRKQVEKDLAKAKEL